MLIYTKRCTLIIKLTEGPTFPWGPASPGRPVRPCEGDRQTDWWVIGRHTCGRVMLTSGSVAVWIYTSAWAPSAPSNSSTAGFHKGQFLHSFSAEELQKRCWSHFGLDRYIFFCPCSRLIVEGGTLLPAPPWGPPVFNFLHLNGETDYSHIQICCLRIQNMVPHQTTR